MKWHEQTLDESFFKRPKDKIAFKIPMTKSVITVSGDFYVYNFVDGRIHWTLIGNDYYERHSNII